MDFKHRQAKVLDVNFSCNSFEEIMCAMHNGIQNRNRGYISITNTESLYHALKKPEHFQYISNATYSCCDGVAVVLAGKLLGQNIPRLHGPDLMIKCCEFGIKKGWKHYFYGGKTGVPAILRQKLVTRYPGLITVGCYSPPFRKLTPKEDKAVIDRINHAKPDVIWVGLGLLKQEKWIADHFNKIDVPWMIGVGAAFDFHAGTIKRAPRFYRDIGLEWLYRLSFEPRMLIRNIYSLMIFYPVIKKVLRRSG